MPCIRSDLTKVIIQGLKHFFSFEKVLQKSFENIIRIFVIEYQIYD